MYLMNKENFTVDGWSEHAAKWNTHIEVTFEQMKYVSKNPAVNGPKLLLYLVTSAGMAQDTKDAGFMELLRREQALQDKGGEKYVPPATVAPEQVAEPVAVAPDAIVATPAPKTPVDEIRDTLMAMEDKALIIKYSTDTLGQALGLDMRWGKERMVNAICEALSAAK